MAKKEEKKAEGEDVTLLERLFDEENDENVILFDEDGKEIELEQIATVNFEDGVYAVLHMKDDPDEEVLVFKVDPDDEESIVMLEDEALANRVLDFVMAQSNNATGAGCGHSGCAGCPGCHHNS